MKYIAEVVPIHTYILYRCNHMFKKCNLSIPSSTVGDSGVRQRQLNGTASKNTLQLSECKENKCITSL